MAFNLNKNDGPEESSTSNTKFDLSKNVVSPEEAGGNRKKSSVLIFLVIGLLLVGGVGWYLLSKKPSVVEKSAPLSTAANITADSSSEVKASLPVADVDKKVANKIPVSFLRGTTSFKSIDKSIVRDIIAQLASNPAAKLEILGYASSEGSIEINQSISQARADAFKRYLISRHVRGDRITTIGKGIEDPIASNDTESGRQKNRRVEVRLN